jgi:hypothetical protein
MRRFLAKPRWLVAGIVVCALLGLGIGWHLSESGTATAASAESGSSADAYERQRDERARRVCDETRTRVMRGATVSAADVEGWVVEYSALFPSQAAARAAPGGLERFVRAADAGRSGRLVWSEAPELVKLDGPTTGVRLAEEPYGALWAVRLTFTGRYVVPYFVEEERGAFMRVAAALSEELKASTSALYARCEHSSSYHLGSWFQGPTPDAAVATLVLLLGTQADVPFIDEALLRADSGVDRADAFERIRGHARTIERPEIARIIGAHGGMISGRVTSTTTLSFAFKDGNAAARASLDLARALGVARASAR